MAQLRTRRSQEEWLELIQECRSSGMTDREYSDRQCALQGLEIVRVEIPSGKELTTPPEVSFELLVVTLVAKRKQ